LAALPDPEKQSLGKPRLFSPGNTLPFVLVTTLFLLWGIPSNLNDVLIKQFMKSFEMNRFQAGLIQSAFYLGYFLLALPAALVMRKYGYKTGRTPCASGSTAPAGLLANSQSLDVLS
jgi:fucose permease